MQSEKLSSYGPKTLILTFANNVRNACSLALPSKFFRFHQNKKNFEKLLTISNIFCFIHLIFIGSLDFQKICFPEGSTTAITLSHVARYDFYEKKNGILSGHSAKFSHFLKLVEIFRFTMCI